MRNRQENFSIKKRLKSFVFAFNGLKVFILTEHNAWMHLAATLVVTVFGVYYRISKKEWIAVCVVIGLVFSMEMINTAIEKLCDVVSPEKRDSIKIVKDISAAAVLLSAVVAVVVGLIIFLPKIL